LVRSDGFATSWAITSRVKKPIVSPFGAVSPSWLLPRMPPAPLTFLITTVGLPGM
jgi:hypothetical protein